MIRVFELTKSVDRGLVCFCDIVQSLFISLSLLERTYFLLPVTLNKTDEVSELKASKTRIFPKAVPLTLSQSAFFLLYD